MRGPRWRDGNDVKSVRRFLLVLVLGAVLAAVLGACGSSTVTKTITASTSASTSTSASASTSTSPTSETSTTSASTPATTTSASTSVAATHPAQTANQDFFYSPSRNISCEIDYKLDGSPGSVVCQTNTPAQSVTLSTSGRLHRCNGQQCLGQGPENAYSLAYGASTTLGPFTCLSTENTGMHCVLPDGQGFEIAVQGITRLS